MYSFDELYDMLMEDLMGLEFSPEVLAAIEQLMATSPSLYDTEKYQALKEFWDNHETYVMPEPMVLDPEPDDPFGGFTIDDNDEFGDLDSDGSEVDTDLEVDLAAPTLL